MKSRDNTALGFTLVELMTVVLIIGILLSIAAPLYVRTIRYAEARACQSNQRTIAGSAQMARSQGDDLSMASAGELVEGGSGWYAILIPEWINRAPSCPADSAGYLLDADGSILGDRGHEASFKEGHEVQ